VVDRKGHVYLFDLDPITTTTMTTTITRRRVRVL
jgi:hypothetical protein